MSRRKLLQRGAALALAAPTTTTLLTACGADDEVEATGTLDGGAASPTAAAAPTATEPPVESTPTTSESEATATGADIAATPTEAAAAEPTSTEETAEINPRWMGRPIEPAQNEGGILVEAGETTQTNPVIESYGQLIGMIFERLVEVHVDTTEPVGVLAESWETSDDGLVWTMSIREGVTWQDGEPLTADDVVFSWESLTNVDTGAPEADYITIAFESVALVDDMTVAFTTKTPTVDFLVDYISWYPTLAAHIWRDIPPQEWPSHPGTSGDDPSFVVGTGPFQLAEFVRDDFARLVRYDGYWDGKPHLDEYIIRMARDDGAVVAQLQTGEIDFSVAVDPNAAAALDPETFNELVSFPGTLQVILLNLDPEKTPLFQDIEVRKALMYAINRQETIDVASNGYGQVPAGLMMPNSWALAPDAITVRYDYDPEMANQILDEAGWVTGADGVREKDGQRLSFTAHVNATYTEAVTRLQMIQEYWRLIGVETEIAAEDGSLLTERRDAGDFEALMRDVYIFTPDQGYLWECGAEANNMKFCDPEVDAAFQRARESFDRDERLTLYTNAQNIILDQLPVLPLVIIESVGFVNNRAHNVYEYLPAGNHFAAETWWGDAE
jgi:peptide/nickel transport system substrate-binding protein